MVHSRCTKRQKVDIIVGTRIVFEGWDPQQQHDIVLEDGKIKQIIPHDPNAVVLPSDTILDGRRHLIAPSLCHAHVHLDKCFLISDPKYADLEIIDGDFTEAMRLTSKAKSRFERDDLLRRGKWLLSESIAAGVTHMRAFVEVDHGVEFKCLDAAIELKEIFDGACEIQICAFAQEPIYSGPNALHNRELMSEASGCEDVEVIGSTPYVEDNETLLSHNYAWSIATASNHDKHVDLHMDYHLNQTCMPFALDVILHAEEQKWRDETSGKTITMGHCTRLSQLHPNEWLRMYIPWGLDC